MLDIIIYWILTLLIMGISLCWLYEIAEKRRIERRYNRLKRKLYR